MRLLNGNELELCSGGELVRDPIWGDVDTEGSSSNIGGLLGGKPMDAIRGLIGGSVFGAVGGIFAGMKLATTGGFLGGAIAEAVGMIYGGIIGGVAGGIICTLQGSNVGLYYLWKYIGPVLGGNI